MSQEKEIGFETALKRLEEIVGQLEDGDLSLEKALKSYEEGVRMADLCTKRLTEAEKKVEILMKTASGKFKTEPFEEGESKPKKKKCLFGLTSISKSLSSTKPSTGRCQKKAITRGA